MSKQNNKTDKQRYEETLQKIQRFRPIDDEFMRLLFKQNIPLAQLVIRIITGMNDLVVTDSVTQYDMKRLAGARSLCLDVYATDSAGKKYDIEVQKAESGARPHRARYHSSSMDIENLKSGQEFEELPDTYTIFITEKDFYKAGEPLYMVDRIVKPIEEEFNDGEHILYVNGEYEGDSDIGKLMHDFRSTKADEMNYDLMAERTRYYKETPKGVSELSKIGEEFREEGSKERALEIATTLLEMGRNSIEEISAATKLPIETIQELAEQECTPA